MKLQKEEKKTFGRKEKHAGKGRSLLAFLMVVGYDDRKCRLRAAGSNQLNEVNTMTIQDVCRLLDGTLVCGSAETALEPPKAYASDMMSDVLACVSDHTLLLSGLINEQVIRTAAMLEIRCVILVRGKKPSEEMLRMAGQNEIALLCTNHTLFETCGILFQNGVRGEV